MFRNVCGRDADASSRLLFRKLTKSDADLEVLNYVAMGCTFEMLRAALGVSYRRYKKLVGPGNDLSNVDVRRRLSPAERNDCKQFIACYVGELRSTTNLQEGKPSWRKARMALDSELRTSHHQRKISKTTFPRLKEEVYPGRKNIREATNVATIFVSVRRQNAKPFR